MTLRDVFSIVSNIRVAVLRRVLHHMRLWCQSVLSTAACAFVMDGAQGLIANVVDRAPRALWKRNDGERKAMEK